MLKAFCNIFRLDTGHVDLYLIHSPYGGDISRTYDAMLELKAQGLIRCVSFIFCCSLSRLCTHTIS